MDCIRPSGEAATSIEAESVVAVEDSTSSPKEDNSKKSATPKNKGFLKKFNPFSQANSDDTKAQTKALTKTQTKAETKVQTKAETKAQTKANTKVNRDSKTFSSDSSMNVSEKSLR